jgi:hypothetical protein
MIGKDLTVYLYADDVDDDDLVVELRWNLAWPVKKKVVQFRTSEKKMVYVLLILSSFSRFPVALTFATAGIVFFCETPANRCESYMIRLTDGVPQPSVIGRQTTYLQPDK